MNAAIRQEQPGDEDAIRELTALAFAASELGHHGEAELIDRLRAACPEMVSLVAEVDGRLVGHILFTLVSIERGELHSYGMGLGPMSVLPAYQGQGIGSRLIEAGLERLGANQVPFVVVLGHTGYYPRFGFVPAARYGITTTFGNAADAHFMIRFLSSVDSAVTPGVARYRPEFDAAP